MKALKKVLVVAGAIIALLLIAALFLPKDFNVVRSVEISKNKTEVFDYVKLLKNQDDFSVWMKRDPNVTKTYKGEDGTVGFMSSWESDKEDVGHGEQEIVKIDDGKRIDYALRFKKPQEMESTAYMTTENAGDASTKVSWGFEFSVPYPFNFFMVFSDMEKELGPDLQQGLDNMKEILESQE